MSAFDVETEVIWSPTLGELTLPPNAVVIVDQDIPSSLIEALPDPLLVQAGESLKRLESIEALAARVLKRRASRPLCLVAVGGGSVGDAVGFLASILWRGVDLWHIPTTLLAMVDSAHGGKTAVNLGDAKNQLGTFYPAARVCLCGDVLATLPFAQREEGLAELVKALWLGDAPALDLLDAEGGVDALAAQEFSEIEPRMRDLLLRAIAVKQGVVHLDPFERKGVRTILNLGHTVAHALELRAHLSHGHAVAWGMACAARLSRTLGHITRDEELRWLRQLDPLLHPIRDLTRQLDRETFCAIVGRDKKRERGKLRSVLVHGPGDPFVTSDITADQWFDTLVELHEAWLCAPREVSLLDIPRERPVSLVLEASKSELNRALIIAALREAPTEVIGYSEADDVAFMQQCLTTLQGHDDDEVVVHCGLGGTTFRFLIALAAIRPAPTVLLVDHGLANRPHGPLFDAVTQLGATITEVRRGEEVGWRVEPSPDINGREVAVRCDTSSQYLSAIALLSASGASFTAILRTAEDAYIPGDLASQSYMEMTFELLEAAGVLVSWHGERVHFAPGPHLGDPCTLTAQADESSAAVWRALRFLGLPLELPNVSSPFSLQADRALERFLSQIGAADPDTIVTCDLQDCPDLAPVLAAVGVLSPCGLALTNAAHLRIKESNRIDDLIASCAAVGVTIEPREDGLFIPIGAQTPTSGARWSTCGDHRLAMAGLVLTARGATLLIERPWVVTKSYPAFWHHARRAGFRAAFVEG